MSESKRYRLLKPLPDANVGDVYRKEGNSDIYRNEYTLTQKSAVIEHNSYFKWQVENNPDFFEEIKPTESKDVFTWECPDCKTQFKITRSSSV